MRYRAPICVALLLAGALARPALADDVILPEEIPVPAESAPEGATAQPAVAPEPAAPPEPSPAANAENLWSFELAVPVYLWLPDMSGKAVIAGATIDYDLSHGDVVDLIFNDLAGILPFYGAVRRDRIGARFDLLWMEFKRVGLSDLNLSPPDLPIDRQSQRGLDMHINLAFFHTALSYRLFETTLDVGPLDYLRIEPLVGFRYVNFAIEAVITDSLVLEEIGMTTLDAKENWWTFVPVGVEVELGFCEKWSLLANVMLGGWGMGTAKGGTDGIADVLLKYRLSENWTAQLGVRWFDMYMKGDDLDLELHNAWGPLIKFAWNF